MLLQSLLSHPLRYAPTITGEGLRILVLVADLPPVSRSGIGISVAPECEAMAQLGCSVHILTACREPLHVHGVPVTPLPATTFPPEFASWDLLHLHSLGLATVALQASRRLKLPLIYTAHTLLEEELPSSQPWIALQQQVLATADHVFFLNHAERERAIVRDPSLRRRSSVRYHGMRKKICSGKRSAHQILVTGRVCRNKGTDIAVAALRNVMQSNPHITAMFTSSPGDSDCEMAIAQFASEFPTRVQRTGWLDHSQLLNALAQARIALCPSRYEPFGLVALEALQCGTPVLASTSDGARELLHSAPGAAFVPSSDHSQWADAIRQELRSGHLLASSATDGPAWVHANFHPVQCAGALLQQLTRLHLAGLQQPRRLHHVA